MKILFADANYSMAGSSHALIELAAALHSRGCETAVATGNAQIAEAFSAFGARTYLVPEIATRRKKFLFRRIVSSDRLASAVKEFAPEIVHANGISSYLAINDSAPEVPALWHIRSLRQEPGEMRYASEHSTIMLCDSETAAERIMQILPSDTYSRLRAIPASIDPAPLIKIAKNPTAAIGYAGCYEEWKRHETLLLAFAEVAKVHPQATLFLPENPPGDIKRLAKKLSIYEKITWQSTQNLVAFLQNIDIYASPAFGEAYPRALRMAAILGKQCTCAESAAQREVVSEHLAIPFPSDDIQALTGNIISLIEGKTVLQTNRDWAAEWENYIGKVENLYRQTLDKINRDGRFVRREFAE